MMLIGSVAAAWAMNTSEAVFDQRIEEICYREVKLRTPLGHRDIETSGYRSEGTRAGVLRGSLKTKASPNQWAKVIWSCRLDRKSGRIYYVEFGRSGSSSRLMAAAAHF